MEIKRAALVTGASRGIGRAIAVRLACDGYHVVVHYNKSLIGAEQTLAQIREQGAFGKLVQFDLADGATVESAMNDFSTTCPDWNIEVLVNNASHHRDGVAVLMSNSAFEDVMRTNTFGSFYLMRWCVKKMIRRQKGCIVNISSLAGQLGNFGQINYSASKAALIAMTKSLCMEVGARGIRVNAIAPGLIDTEMIAQIPNLDLIKSRIPLGRFGLPEDVAGAVSFLCSKDASYITGTVLSVNGGLVPI